MDDEMLPCVRGYQIYYSIRNSCVGEMLCCEADGHNLHDRPRDRLAVSVKKYDVTVGHIDLPERFLSCAPRFALEALLLVNIYN